MNFFRIQFGRDHGVSRERLIDLLQWDGGDAIETDEGVLAATRRRTLRQPLALVEGAGSLVIVPVRRDLDDRIDDPSLDETMRKFIAETESRGVH